MCNFVYLLFLFYCFSLAAFCKSSGRIVRIHRKKYKRFKPLISFELLP